MFSCSFNPIKKDSLKSTFRGVWSKIRPEDSSLCRLAYLGAYAIQYIYLLVRFHIIEKKKILTVGLSINRFSDEQTVYIVCPPPPPASSGWDR
jgi:hypothetical protein